MQDKRKTRNPRHGFKVRDQLLAKLGSNGYGRLLQHLLARTVEPKED